MFHLNKKFYVKKPQNTVLKISGGFYDKSQSKSKEIYFNY